MTNEELRKLTKKSLQNWLCLVEKSSFPKLGCTKCNSADGFLKKPREPIGFDLTLCDCRKEHEIIKSIARKREASGISEKMSADRYPFSKYTFSHLDFDQMREVILNDGWLFLTGGAGTGKTYTAVTLAKIAMAFQRTTYFGNVASVLESLRPTTDDDSRLSVKKRLKFADVLVLDDIGHEKASEWVREQLYLIINQRWQEKKCTIFTSNFPCSDLKTRISEAVFSRVKGESLEINFNSDGKDKRIHKT